jgi:hypothetical protein
VESAQGGLVLDAKTKYFAANNNNNVGRGGVVIVPFLDYNNNGRRDKDEPKILGLEVVMTGGRIEQNKKDSSIRVFNLEPYIKYNVFLNPNSFDNISWKIRNPIISVIIDPNQFKLIEVPVAVVGEVAGMVYLKGNLVQKGQGRVILRFYRSDSVLMAKTVTEPDGYFNYLGLPPGSYYAMVDPDQLHKLDMKATPSSISFIIKKSKDGDVADGLEFIIRPRIEDTVSKVQLKPEEKRKTQQVLPEDKGEKVKSVVKEGNSQPSLIKTDSIGKTEYVIQVMSFHNESYAIALQNHLSKALNWKVEIDHEGDFFKVRVVSFTGIQEAKDFLAKVFSEGFQQAFITKRTKR